MRIVILKDVILIDGVWVVVLVLKGRTFNPCYKFILVYNIVVNKVVTRLIKELYR